MIELIFFGLEEILKLFQVIQISFSLGIGKLGLFSILGVACFLQMHVKFNYFIKN
jgi:hypothetical protein